MSEQKPDRPAAAQRVARYKARQRERGLEVLALWAPKDPQRRRLIVEFVKRQRQAYLVQRGELPLRKR